MPPYQHLFSTSAVLNVWRNLRTNSRDHNDLLLTFQIPAEDLRGNSKKVANRGHGLEGALEENALQGRGDVAGASKSIGFVVPWRSMQAQKRELREKERELADALVVLAGEVAFTDLAPNLLNSLSTNPLVQIRHLCAGLSRQLSKIELQMADNAPFARGKNLYTGGEIARRFLPAIGILFDQRPVPQRMIFELCLELKDLVYAGMAACEKEVLEWEYSNFNTFEDLDETILRAITPLSDEKSDRPDTAQPRSTSTTRKRLGGPALTGTGKTVLRPRSTSISTSRPSKASLAASRASFAPFPNPSSPQTLYFLESLETTSAAMSHLPLPCDDFLAKSIITLRRLLDRRSLAAYAQDKRRREGRCAEYARCMRWGGKAWRAGGGCRRGCAEEEEGGEEGPSWFRRSRWFEGVGE